jgi:hypothetical protein
MGVFLWVKISTKGVFFFLFVWSRFTQKIKDENFSIPKIIDVGCFSDNYNEYVGHGLDC